MAITHQQIADELDGAAREAAQVRKAAQDAFVAKCADIQARCGSIGHVWALGRSVGLDSTECCVCRMSQWMHIQGRQLTDGATPVGEA